MKLLLQNFMSHEATSLELPARGIVQVTGPNGAGKSAIIEAISTALWGKPLRSGKWSPWRSTAGVVKLKDQNLFVSREWNGKTKSLKWNAEVIFDTTTKSQEALETIVGQHEVWRRTCVFSASDAAHFTMASDAERKELLESLLGLGWFDRALDSCRTELRAARGSLNATERDREVAVARAEVLTESLANSRSTLAGLPPDKEVGLLRADLTRLSEHLRSCQADLAEVEAVRRKLAHSSGGDGVRIEMLRMKLNQLQVSQCSTCGQAIPDSLRKELTDELDKILAAADAARAAVADRVAETEAEAAELRQDASKLQEITANARAAIAEIDRARSLREKLTRDIASFDGELERQTEKIATLLSKALQLGIDIAELEACEQILGVRGARAHVVGKTLRSIELLANNWMARLASDIKIHLKPYTEKKSGGVVDAISLTLDGAGGDHGYMGASAGERRRVDVAILLALAELASSAATASSWRSPLFFDEVFDSLDGDGREAVAELVESLAVDRCVVLITHDEHVASCRADLRLRIDGGKLCTS